MLALLTITALLCPAQPGSLGSPNPITVFDPGRFEGRRKEPYKKGLFKNYVLCASCSYSSLGRDEPHTTHRKARVERMWQHLPRASTHAIQMLGKYSVTPFSILLNWVLGDKRQNEVTTFINSAEIRHKQLPAKFNFLFLPFLFPPTFSKQRQQS